MPNENYFGSKGKDENGVDEYQWQTLKEVADNAENFSLGLKALNLCTEIEAEGKKMEVPWNKVKKQK